MLNIIILTVKTGLLTAQLSSNDLLKSFVSLWTCIKGTVLCRYVCCVLAALQSFWFFFVDLKIDIPFHELLSAEASRILLEQQKVKKVQ